MVVVKTFLNVEVPMDGFGLFDSGQVELSTLPERTDVTPEAVDTGWQLVEVVAVVAMALVVAAILGGNLLVISSIARFKRLQVPSNFLLLSLAVADVCVALAAPFFLGVEVMRERVPGGPLTCLLPNRALATASGVSTLTLAAVAYDRYTSLACPLEYAGIITAGRVGVFVGGSWLLAGLVSWLPVLVPGLGLEPAGPCSLKLVPPAAHILFVSALFLPVCLTMFLCYGKIYSVARRHARAIAAVERSVHRHLRVRYQPKDPKYAKTLLLILGVFLLLWVPYLACSMVDVFDPTLVPDWVRNFLAMLSLLNSGLNPWVYAYKNYEFRNAFSRLFKENARRWWLCWHEEDRRSSVLSDSSLFHASSSSSGGIRHCPHLHHHHHPHLHHSHHHAHCNPLALGADFVRTPVGSGSAACASVVAGDHNFSTFPRVLPRVLYPYAVQGENYFHEKGRQPLRDSAQDGHQGSEVPSCVKASLASPTVRWVVHNPGGSSHTHTVDRAPSAVWQSSMNTATSPVLMPAMDNAVLSYSRPSTHNLLLVHSSACARDGLQGLIVEPSLGNPCQVLVPHCDIDKLLDTFRSNLDPAPASYDGGERVNPLLHCDKRQLALTAPVSLE